MTNVEFARYFGRLQDARTDAELLAIELELAGAAPEPERDVLLRFVRRMRMERPRN